MTNPISVILKGLQEKTQSLVPFISNQLTHESDTTSSVNPIDCGKITPHESSPTANPEVADLPRDRRQLRSLDDKPNDTLFQYSILDHTPDYDGRISLIRGSSSFTSGLIVTKSGDSDRGTYLRPDIVEYSYGNVDAEGPTKVDPLGDNLFLPHHRRLEREEKGIQRIERDRNMIEVDRIMVQREALLGPSWKKDILRITAINDPNDMDEMEMKRELTLAEINGYLDRYHEWKRKDIQSRYHRKEAGRQSQEDMNGDYSSPPLQIAIKASKKLKATPVKPFLSFFPPYAVRPKFEQLAKRGHRVDLAFGYKVPTFTVRDFDIPDDWKPYQS